MTFESSVSDQPREGFGVPFLRRSLLDDDDDDRDDRNDRDDRDDCDRDLAPSRTSSKYVR